MHRIFQGGAVVACGLLLANAWLGTRSMALAATIASFGAHAAAWAITGRSLGCIRRLATEQGWPDWMAAQAEKNREKTLAYGIWGGALAVAMVGSGRAGVGPLTRLGLATATLVFHLGAFAADNFLIAAQSRLVRDYVARGEVAPIGPLDASGPGG
jgi:hypothetical protein